MVCASCGFENPGEFRFCGSCGAPLPEAAAGGGDERKIVSVLFADLVGFTDRAERLDPEDVRAELRPYHGLLRRELERFGGTVEKFIGDAVMALFGAPVAHEDDAERAVRAALAIRDAIADLNEREGLELEVRIAVNTGEAIVALDATPSKGEGMASGDVVNTAFRLQEVAPPGGVLVSEPTFRATEHAIAYRDAEPVRVKGKANPLTVREAVGPRSPVGAGPLRRGAARLVGRSAELELLRNALGRTRVERVPRLVTLVGVPGIGKSRLVAELFEDVRDGAERALWRAGRSLPYGEGVAYWAVGEMTKAHAGILESDSAEAADAKLRRAVADVLPDEAEARWVESRLRPLVGLGPETEAGGDGRAESFAAWRRFFEALAEQRALVLVFEDLHWADDGLLDFVDDLVDWVSDASLLVLATARPELLERRPGWGGAKPNADTVSLAPLGAEEMAELVRELVPEGEPQAGDIAARAAGNPLYAEEYVRMLRDRGSDPGTTAPQSVQGIIAARIDALPPDEKAVLQDAAVLGPRSWVGALAHVTGLPRWSVEEHLHRLERKEFVARERRSSVAGESAFAFRHVLIRDVAYGQIPRRRRAQTHRLAADWLESLAVDRTEDHADLRAHHLGAAVEYMRALGTSESTLTNRARAALADAGDRAAALHGFREAARFYREALALDPPPDVRATVLLHLGRALFMCAGDGGDELREARDLLLGNDRWEEAAWAEMTLGELCWLHGDAVTAHTHFGGSRAFVEGSPTSPEKARVAANVARFLMVSGDGARSIEAAREAIALAEELGLDEVRAHALSTLGVARGTCGDFGGIRDLEESVTIDRALGSVEIVRSLNNLAYGLASLGELERAFGVYAEARTAAQRFGVPWAIRWLAVEHLHELYWRGDWDDALAGAHATIAEAQDGAPYIQEVDARVVRATIRLARGDAAGAVDDADRALAFARAVKDPQTLFPALAISSRVHAETGRTGSAGDLTTDLLGRWAEHGGTLPGFWVADLAFALDRLGRASDLLAVAQTEPARTRWLDAARAVAAGELTHAAEIYAAIGSRPDEAYARLLAGEREAALAFFAPAAAREYARRAEAFPTAARRV